MEEIERENLESRIQEAMLPSIMLRTNWWNDKRWNDYLYKTKEKDFLQLPVLNEYLSEWNENYSYDESVVFKECRNLLKIIDDLKFAIAVCASSNSKEIGLWQEGIENIKNATSEKLDYMTFMILKDAKKYPDSKSENMEYSIVEGDEDDSILSLGLWANTYRTFRRNEVRILDHKFKLPMDAVMQDCAVRLMHTSFNLVSPEKFTVAEELANLEDFPLETEISLHADKKVDPDENHEFQENAGETLAENGETVENIERKIKDDIEEKEEDIVQEDKISSFEEETEISKAEEPEFKSAEETFLELPAIVNPNLLPPLREREIKRVDLDEYFVVGGIYYFELFRVPIPNEHKGAVTYIHREPVKLRKIPFKKKIFPPRPIDGSASYSYTVYERERYKKELANGVLVELLLPKNVIFLSSPEPARFFPEKEGFSTDCIFEKTYSEDTGKISFITNQFGIFGILQKKYENFPYEDWSLTTRGDKVLFSLKGKRLEIKIGISQDGFSVVSINPCDDLIFSKLSSKWMLIDLLIDKLNSLGINIVYGHNAENLIDIPKKNFSMENKIYDSIALLCDQYGFCSIPQSRDEEILIGITPKQDGDARKVIIRTDGVHDFETEQKRAAETLNTECDGNGDPTEGGGEEGEIPEQIKTEKDTVEDPKIEKESVEDFAEKESEMPSEEIDKGMHIPPNLYEFVMEGIGEDRKEKISSLNVTLITNVRTILRICRPISSTHVFL